MATGQQSTNHRTEAYALLAAAKTQNQEERLPTNTVFLTDCRSILQSLQSPGGDQIFSNIRQELSLLKNKTSVTLQWIPSHCGVGGNEEADRLSKMESKLEQSAHPMSYNEAKTILRNNFRTEWWQRLDIGTEEDNTQQLDRAAQFTTLDWELDTVNSSPTSTDWTFPIQTNVHAAQVLKPTTTSCSPDPPSTLWDARHGLVRWMPTGTFGDQLSHCGRLWTSPYSPDWRSSMAGNAEEDDLSNNLCANMLRCHFHLSNIFVCTCSQNATFKDRRCVWNDSITTTTKTKQVIFTSSATIYNVQTATMPFSPVKQFVPAYSYNDIFICHTICVYI